ncbi:piggyBac transposable element-derived protein 3 [Ixodes scapularis]
MDASTFYGSAELSNHARNRTRMDNDSAQRLLMKIADGNTSDIGLTDDEDAELPPPQPADTPGGEPGPSAAVQAPSLPENDAEDEGDTRTKQKTRTVWMAKDFAPPDVSFECNQRPLEEVAEPVEYFSRYFPEPLFEEMARCTNIYVLETTGAILATTPEEIKTFLGMLMIMGTLKFPRIRMYWQTATQIPVVSEAMSVNRFFKLRSALHITESSSPRSPTDKFWKVRPLLDAIRERCLTLPPCERNSIDEQMVPFTGRVAAKQFVRNKPNPEGVKVFIRCSSEGMAYDFELYQGKGTGTSEEHKHLGLGGSIVMRLVEHMPKFGNFKCYFDNYFTSVPLLRELKEVGIWAVGTIRANRLQGCVLKPEKELRREGRGSLDYKVTREGDVTLVRWQDNGNVNIASTYVGVENLSTVRRWSEATKQHVDIACPAIIKEYNAFMGGVDKMDYLLSLYPLRQRTKKWTVRVMSHFVSFGIVNSWLEYLRDAQENRTPRKSVLDLLGFQNEVALSLITCNKAVAKKRGRPSLQQAGEPPKKVHNAEPRPVRAVRYDGLNHWPAHVAQTFAQRCKFEGCTSRTRIRCRKCNVYLCLSANNDCFFAFHNK